MLNPDILEENPISLAELKTEIKKIQKRDKELGFRSGKTVEYLNLFSHVDEKKSKELSDKLTALNIPRLKDIHIKKIVDLMPASVNELKVILQGYTISVNNDNLKKIIDSVGEYLPKKKEK